MENTETTNDYTDAHEIDVARVVALESRIERTARVGADGREVELHSAELPRLRQLRTALEFVRHSISERALGSAGKVYYLGADSFQVLPINLRSEAEECERLEHGYELQVRPPSDCYSRQLTAEDLRALRGAARDAALLLLQNKTDLTWTDWDQDAETQTSPWPRLSSAKEKPESARVQHLKKLKGRAITMPFSFTNFESDDLIFMGEFAGEEEYGGQLEDADLVGLIRVLDVRPESLNFLLETSSSLFSHVPNEQYRIEYSPGQFADVHRLAGTPEQPVRIKCRLHEQRVKNGGKNITYSVSKIDSVDLSEGELLPPHTGINDTVDPANSGW